MKPPAHPFRNSVFGHFRGACTPSVWILRRCSSHTVVTAEHPLNWSQPRLCSLNSQLCVLLLIFKWTKFTHKIFVAMLFHHNIWMLTTANMNVFSEPAAHRAINEDTGGCLDTRTLAEMSDSSEEQRGDVFIFIWTEKNIDVCRNASGGSGLLVLSYRLNKVIKFTICL